MKTLMILVVALGAQDSAKDARQKLESMRMSVDFAKADLHEVVTYLSEATGMNFVIHPDVENEQEVSIQVRDLKLVSILRLMLKPKGLTATWSDGVIQVVTKEQAQKRTMKTQIYDVRELTSKLQDFPGPRVELATSNSEPLTGAVFIIDEPKEVLGEQMIIDLIRESTGEGTWDEGDSAIELVNGLLVVRQSSKVQAEVRKLLQKMRQFR